jgi:hypothetical protein
MTDKNLAEKITDTIAVKITSAINETKMFEKISDVTNYMGLYIGAFTLFTSVIGITNIAIHYSNINSSNENTKLLRENIFNISQGIEMNRYNFDNKINKLEIRFNKLLESKFNTLLEIQKNCLNEINNLHIERKNYISKSTSISGITFISDKEDVNQEELLDEYKKINYVLDEKDDELLNECYDSLPLNNFKKNTALNWLF